MWLVVSEGAKSILSISVCWHSPYCAILPAILPDKQSRLSRGAIDGGGGTEGWGACMGGKAHIYERRAHISSPAVSSPSQRWKVSWAPSRRTLSLPLYTSVPLLFRQHHNTLWQLSSWRINMDSLQTPPVVLLLSFLNSDPADSPAKVSSRGLLLTC